MKKNYYQILELTQTATAEEIKKAYRRLSKKYHPDANPGNMQAQERFQEISEAYVVLGDEKKRKEYDVKLQEGSRQQGQAQKQKTGGQGNGRRPENQEFQWNRDKRKSTNPLDVSDLFEKYMGIKK